MTGADAFPYTVGVTAKCAATLAFLMICSVAMPGLAEHEIYYRYIVLGYLTDAAGQPRRGARVELVREKTGFSYLAETDASGLYVIVARLGDESVSEPLRLTAEGQAITVTARFDPSDHVHERGTRVDFVGASPVEMPTAFDGTFKRFLAQ